MAYTDFSFYTETYHGDVLTEGAADKWLDRASDEVDSYTFYRLTEGLPTVEAHAARVKKAVCAVADALYCVEEQRKAVSAQVQEDGTYRGAIASISSGKESVSYAVAGASGMSAYAAAAASTQAFNALIGDIVTKYLKNIPDNNGVNLLYAGVL